MLFGDYDGIKEVRGYQKLNLNPKPGDLREVIVKLPGIEQKLKSKKAVVCLGNVAGYPHNEHIIAIQGNVGVLELFSMLMGISEQIEQAMENIAKHVPKEKIALDLLRAVLNTGQTPE